MEVIKIKKMKHYIFDDEEEFKNFFRSIDYPIPPIEKDWRKAPEGSWVWSDDGRIIQILKRGPMKPYGEFVRTCVGTFNTNSKSGMDTDVTKHPDRYTFTTKPYSVRLEREKLTRRELQFIYYIYKGDDIFTAYKKAFNTNSVNVRAKLKQKLTTKRFMMALNRNIEAIAEELGIDFYYIMGKLKEISDTAKSDQAKITALSKLIEMLGKEEEKTTYGHLQIRSPFSDTELLEIEAEEKETLQQLNSREENG